MIENYDVIIIGAGPAGLTAGIYTCRNQLKTLILSMDMGGQAAVSGEIENWPGEKKIAGADLIVKFKEHCLSYPEAKLEQGKEVLSIAKQNDGFKIKTKDGSEYLSRTIIVASGKCPKKLTIPGAKELEGKGVAYCATCDGPLYKDKTVAIVGGGNSALRTCEILSRQTTKIYLLTLTEKPAGEKIIVEKILGDPKIEVIGNAEIIRVIGTDKVTGLKYKDLSRRAKADRKTSELKELKIDGIFVNIGTESSSKFLGSLVKTNERGEIVVEKNCATSCPGIFAAGDITDNFGEQIVIAAGEGARAAMATEQYLAQKETNQILRKEVKKMEDQVLSGQQSSPPAGGSTPAGTVPVPDDTDIAPPPAGQSPLGGAPPSGPGSPSPSGPNDTPIPPPISPTPPPAGPGSTGGSTTPPPTDEENPAGTSDTGTPLPPSGPVPPSQDKPDVPTPPSSPTQV